MPRRVAGRGVRLLVVGARGSVAGVTTLARSERGLPVAIATQAAVAVAAILANVVGAVIVYAVAGLALPTPADVADPARQRVINLAALGIYLGVAVPIGAALGVRLVRPTLAWLIAERAPTAEQQRRALRYPLAQARVNAGLWVGALVVFAALNAAVSWRLALLVSITVLLGGISTVTVGYLLLGRVWRRVAAAALRHDPPERAALPGVTSTLVLAWVLATGVPTVGIVLVALAPIGLPNRSFDLSVLVLSVIVLVIGFLAQVVAARSVADPLRGVRAALEQVGRGDLDVRVPVNDGGEIGLLQAGVNGMVDGLRDRERLRDLFGRQVGHDVAAAALADAPRLGGEAREVAVLFVDLVGSTALAVRRPPAEVVDLLNRFFAAVVAVVAEHGGFVNKFEGDAALCVFGAPTALPDAATSCLCAARSLATRLADLPGGVVAAIGASAGTAVAGYVGAETRYEYTVIGDPVNAAARLTDLAKDDPGRVLASGELLAGAAAPEAACWRLGEDVVLRGRSAATRLARPRAGAGCAHA